MLTGLAVGGDVHEHDDVGAAGVAGPGVGADDQEVGAGALLSDLGAVGGGDRGRASGRRSAWVTLSLTV